MIITPKVKNLYYVTRPPLILGALLIYIIYIYFLTNQFNYQNILRCYLITLTSAFGNVVNNYIDYEMDLKFKENDNLIWDRDVLNKKDYFYFSIFLFLASFFSVPILSNRSLMLVSYYELFHSFIYSFFFKQTILKNIFFLGSLLTPMIEGYLMGYNFHNSLYYGINMFVFFFPREIVNDINDYKGDKEFGLRTIPIMLGIEKTFALIKIIEFSWFIIQCFAYSNNIINFYSYLYNIFIYLSFLLLNMYNKNNKNHSFNVKKIQGAYLIKMVLDNFLPSMFSFIINFIFLLLFFQFGVKL